MGANHARSGAARPRSAPARSPPHPRRAVRPASSSSLDVAPGNALPKLGDRSVPRVLKGAFEKSSRVEDVSLHQLSHCGIPVRERLSDRSMLLEIEGVELVELRTQRPDGLSMEDATRAPCRLRELLDSGRLEIDVVEVAVCAHPLSGKGLGAAAGRRLAKVTGESGETLLGSLEPAQVRRRHSFTREFRCEALECCPDDEGLEQFGPREGSDLHAALACEGDESQSSELPERFANR